MGGTAGGAESWAGHGETFVDSVPLTGALRGEGKGSVREPLRAKLLRSGAGALTDSELMTLLLGGGRTHAPQTVAQELVGIGGGLRALLQEDPQELCSRRGLGPAKAAQVLAALELGRRAQRSTETRPRLRTPLEIDGYLRPQLAVLRREVFHVLCFNSRNVLLRDARVAEGTMNLCPVDPREVFSAALAARATAIVIAHNHPSGDPQPSTQDIALTRQLAEGARILGLRLLDHVVIGETSFVSMLEQGLLQTRHDTETRTWAAGSLT